MKPAINFRKEKNMGLDMYLTGKKSTMPDWDNPVNDETVDGFRLKNKELDLGYWRKHPDLHGFIVNRFGGGVDTCQRIELTAADIACTINAIKGDELPHTEGFFFGESTNDPEQKAEAIEIFEKALTWTKVEIPREFRFIYYQASW
ncbi:hypothetical protein N9891_00010 [bacterium]|nr:hypothetical protein [bacterium]